MTNIALIERQCLHCADVLVQGEPLYRQVWAAAVVQLPPAGRGDESLAALELLGEQLGASLGERAWQALRRADAEPLSYGKGAIVGSACRIEHAAAILHPRLGKSLRAVIGGGPSLIPSTVKHAAAGACLDIPLHGVDDEWNFSLLDSVEVRFGNAPLPDQIVVVIALAAGGRAFASVGKKYS